MSVRDILGETTSTIKGPDLFHAYHGGLHLIHFREWIYIFSIYQKFSFFMNGIQTCDHIHVDNQSLVFFHT